MLCCWLSVYCFWGVGGVALRRLGVQLQADEVLFGPWGRNRRVALRDVQENPSLLDLSSSPVARPLSLGEVSTVVCQGVLKCTMFPLSLSLSLSLSVYPQHEGSQGGKQTYSQPCECTAHSLTGLVALASTKVEHIIDRKKPQTTVY